MSLCSILKNINITTATYTFLNRYVHRKVNNVPVGGSFTPVYRFPYVPICSVINKYKKIQICALAVSTPASYFSYVINICDEQVPFIVSVVGVATTIAIFSVGQLFTRLIGYIYVSRNQKQVKLAYLDFWGKREDITYDIQDVLPLKDKNSHLDLLYKTVNVSSSVKPFKINLTLGEILHDSLFNQVFKCSLRDMDYSFKKK